MKKLVITYTPAAWFKMMRDSAADLPSAWYAFCELTGCDRNPRELPMHASDYTTEDRAYLRGIFKRYGMRVPRILYSENWDT